jgi:excinuclease UvrABC ATPase subunit
MSGSGWLILNGASGNKLGSLDAAIPVGPFACVTGMNGSVMSRLFQTTLRARLLYQL